MISTLFKGILMAIFPISMAMSIIDLIINRIYNSFMPSPTMFDMLFGNFKGINIWSEEGVQLWIQQNDISTLLGTTIWQFALYSLVFIAGIFIVLIYYRSSNPLRVLISISPVLLIIPLSAITKWIPEFIKRGVIDFTFSAFLENSYIAALNFGIIGAVFIGFIYLLIRRVVVKV